MALLASVAFAGSPYQKTTIRSIVLSDAPSEATHPLYVSGQVATVLRFEQEPNPAKTKLVGWEGRFEPLLVGSHKVVLLPIHDLAEEERASLVVTLADGTQIPFLIRPARKEGPWTDHQVSVFQYDNTYGYVRLVLNDALKRQRLLQEENARLKADDRSGDHGLAAVLMNEGVRNVAFTPAARRLVKDGGLAMDVELFSAPGKAATVITLANEQGSLPWRFGEVRVSTNRTSVTARPFSYTIDRDEIGPGETGKISIVVDGQAFVSERGFVDLAVQIFSDDGTEQLLVNLEHTLVQR